MDESARTSREVMAGEEPRGNQEQIPEVRELISAEFTDWVLESEPGAA